MKEAISLFVMFALVAIVYEYMKPKNNYNETNQQNNEDDFEKDEDREK